MIILRVGLKVLGFPVLRVSFGILVFLPQEIVFGSCLHCSCLLYVCHLIFLQVLYFPALFSFHFWRSFFSHSFGHPLNLELGQKTLCLFPYLLLLLMFILVLYLAICCASRAHVLLVWPVCWCGWLASTMFVP